MKKITKYGLIAFILFISFSNVVLADDFEFCREETFKVFKALGIILNIIKIVVPIIIIVIGSIDFGKAIVSDDDKAIKDAGMMLVKRLAAGVIIFFIPTIINTVISFISNSDKTTKDADFIKCTNCMLDTSKCS